MSSAYVEGGEERSGAFARPRRAARAAGGWLEQVAGMASLTARATAATLRPPFAWREEFVEEAWLILRRCWMPLVLSTVFLGFSAPGLQASNFLNLLGSEDRLGAFFVMASVREFAPFLTGMIVAGVGGTAICADLGARKIREELDALAVLGIDAVETVVAPRFVALGVATALLSMTAIVFGVFGGWLAAVVVFGETTAGFLSTFSSNFTLPDLLGSVAKTSLFGFLVAIVCCQLGMTAKGGPEGVGRAVNQAVVVSFAGIWLVNYVFTSTLLAAFPETANLH